MSGKKGQISGNTVSVSGMRHQKSVRDHGLRRIEIVLYCVYGHKEEIFVGEGLVRGIEFSLVSSNRLQH